MKIHLLKNSPLRESLVLLAILSAALFVACTPEEIDPLADYDPSVKATLSVNRDSYEASCDSGRFVVRIKSSYLWKIEIPDDATWLTCSETWGDSVTTKKVTFRYEANNTAKERSAVVTIRSGKARKKLLVSQERLTKVLEKGSVDVSRIYIPQELRNNDFYKSSSTWYFGRSRQSEHFIVFWGRDFDEYGEDVTPTNCSAQSMRVDIDDLLQKAEHFYAVNIDRLKFAETGVGKSKLDKYKMMIFLFYQDEWLATGGGYDDVVGALWINPGTCHPVSSTIAHEIGHSFQYQVNCDLGGSTGFRHATGQGCGFWEQCAQWQSYQSYPDEAYSSYNFTVFKENHHRHFLHEHQRYASYWLQWYWTDKYGIDAVGRVWRESKRPDDAVQNYARIFNLSPAELNKQLYEYAARCCTWDFSSTVDDGKSIGDYGKGYVGALNDTKMLKKNSDGSYQIRKEMTVEATGFNIFSLGSFSPAAEVAVNFTGLPNASGYNSTQVDASIAGWTVGFVALMGDGTRAYSEPLLIGPELSGTARWTVPEGTSKLWMVVSATPAEYMTHLWDENDDNDAQWPYKFSISGALPK
ncbi:MAG: BACON domain-containing protein [Bacteroidaceae bacterium]|nr:BACON domain-containing protein [Bacteroidaceae bacterium]